MELVDGEDLARRLARGPVPIDEALPIARQIAAALEAAHDAGIVHRDLKPANIKLSDDGVVKVLDFGLAKAIGPATGIGQPATEILDSPTITTPAMTQAGMILGTAAYMSPEQAKGRPADKRADVWAFGCVLYEMLTGARAFEGEDVGDTLAAILRAEPDWTRIPADVPDSVRQLIRGCLEKDRRARVPDIAVVRYALDDKFGRPSAPATTVVAPAAPSRRFAVILAAAAFAIGVLGTMVMLRSRLVPVTGASPQARIAALTDPPLYVAAAGGSLAIAADASFIVYLAGATASDNRLVVRPLDSLTATPLEGTVNARFPFISPDNKWIGFFTGRELKKIAVSGGEPIALCAYEGLALGGTWSEDGGTIVFASTLDAGLMQVPASGGTPTPLTRPFDAGNRPLHQFPTFLPGGTSVLFSILPPGASSTSIATLDLKTGVITTVQPDGGFVPTYLPSGHIVSDRAGRLQARAFDIETGKVSGDAVTVATGITQTSQGYASYAVSRSGVLIYTTATGNASLASRTLVWVDRQGNETPVGTPIRSYEVARISPDGGRIAVDSRDEESDIWIWDTARSTMSRLTRGSSDDMAPMWANDGMVYYSSNRPGIPNGYRQRADGAGAIERVTESRGTQFLTSIAQSGGELALFQFTDGNEAIAVVPLTGQLPVADERIVIEADSSHRFGAEISPDGRWLAFHSNESGRFEVYVRPFPNVDSGRSQISSEGGTRAAWSRNGKELFYLDPNGLLTSVTISIEGGQLSAGRPATILKTAYVAGLSARGLQLRSYDVSPDGQRFLMVKDVAARPTPASPVPLVVVTGWLEELKQRVPSK
jgi:serine/threonine-protein kinase